MITEKKICSFIICLFSIQASDEAHALHTSLTGEIAFQKCSKLVLLTMKKQKQTHQSHVKALLAML